MRCTKLVSFRRITIPTCFLSGTCLLEERNGGFPYRVLAWYGATLVMQQKDYYYVFSSRFSAAVCCARNTDAKRRRGQKDAPRTLAGSLYLVRDLIGSETFWQPVDSVHAKVLCYRAFSRSSSDLERSRRIQGSFIPRRRYYYCRLIPSKYPASSFLRNTAARVFVSIKKKHDRYSFSNILLEAVVHPEGARGPGIPQEKGKRRLTSPRFKQFNSFVKRKESWSLFFK